MADGAACDTDPSEALKDACMEFVAAFKAHGGAFDEDEAATKAAVDAKTFYTFLRGEWKTNDDMCRGILRGLRTAYYCASHDPPSIKAKIVGHGEAWCKLGQFICGLDPLKVPCKKEMSNASEEFSRFIQVAQPVAQPTVWRLDILSQLFFTADALARARPVATVAASFELIVTAVAAMNPYAARELVLACM